MFILQCFREVFMKNKLLYALLFYSSFCLAQQHEQAKQNSNEQSTQNIPLLSEAIAAQNQRENTSVENSSRAVAQGSHEVSENAVQTDRATIHILLQQLAEANQNLAMRDRVLADTHQQLQTAEALLEAARKAERDQHLKNGEQDYDYKNSRTVDKQVAAEQRSTPAAEHSRPLAVNQSQPGSVKQQDNSLLDFASNHSGKIGVAAVAAAAFAYWRWSSSSQSAQTPVIKPLRVRLPFKEWQEMLCTLLKKLRPDATQGQIRERVGELWDPAELEHNELFRKELNDHNLKEEFERIKQTYAKNEMESDEEAIERIRAEARGCAKIEVNDSLPEQLQWKKDLAQIYQVLYPNEPQHSEEIKKLEKLNDVHEKLADGIFRKLLKQKSQQKAFLEVLRKHTVSTFIQLKTKLGNTLPSLKEEISKLETMEQFEHFIETHKAGIPAEERVRALDFVALLKVYKEQEDFFESTIAP